MALSHTILAALSTGEHTGYDLLKGFSSGNGCFWQATQQQIYRELGKLEEQGLITPEVIPQTGKPDKKLYSITETGETKLREWVGQPSKPSPIREELLVKVLALHLVDPSLVQAELIRRRGLHIQQLEAYESLWSDRQCHQLSELPLTCQCTCMVLRRGIRYERSWVEWCEETLDWLKALQSQA